MSKQVLNNGEPASEHRQKLNENFDELYALAAAGVSDFANDPDTTAGLTYGYKRGFVRKISGNSYEVSAGTIGVQDDNSTTIFWDPDTGGIESGSSTPFGAFLLASVTAVGGEIVSIKEFRAFANAFGSPSGRELIRDLGPDPSATHDLYYAHKPGHILASDGGPTAISGGAVTVADDATSNVFYSNLVSGMAAREENLPMPVDAIMLASVTAESGQITNVQDKRSFVNGGARYWRTAIADGGFVSTDGLELTIALGNSDVRVLFANGLQTLAGTVTLEDFETNFVEAQDDGQIVSNISGFTLGNLPLLEVMAADGAVSQVDDRRPFASVPPISDTQTVVLEGADDAYVSDDTLADVLSINVGVGTFVIEAVISTLCAPDSGGAKAAIAGTCTASRVRLLGLITYGNQMNSNDSEALGDPVVGATEPTAAHIYIDGTIVVTVAGNLRVQVAQNEASGNTTTIRRGSFLTARRLPVAP